MTEAMDVTVICGGDIVDKRTCGIDEVGKTIDEMTKNVVYDEIRVIHSEVDQD